jgi:hypothetical protein
MPLVYLMTMRSYAFYPGMNNLIAKIGGSLISSAKRLSVTGGIKKNRKLVI